MAKRHTTIEAHGSHAWMNSNGVLGAGADNVLCSRLASATHAAMNASAGDSIDRGLALLAELKKQGFGVVYLGEPSEADESGVNPSAPAYRLLTIADTIQAGDECLRDDAVTWGPLAGWEVGMRWHNGLMPLRRRTNGMKGGGRG